ncbi:hypothetical protein ACFVMC_29250 [Nocardia sp. NPDC127579]|uniref:hypothetical protein n=1 Tax=Nocardia sp. NPDC127579 TaxID=3345402 RepID=UPI003631BFAB
MQPLICRYCAHRNHGADPRCAHCGAPLEAEEPRRSSVIETAVQVEQAVVDTAEKDVAAVGKALAHRYPPWQWRTAAAAIVVLAALGFWVARSCSMSLPSVPRPGSIRALPGALESAASCRQANDAPLVENCAIRADHPMLLGGISGGRELTFTVRQPESGELTATVAHWRTAAGVVLVDGPVFVAIGPDSAVWYANSASGVRLETTAFSGRAGAQAFLARSGLLGQQ